VKIFYSPKQNVPDNDSFSPSAGKPALFVEAATARFGDRVEVVGDFRGVSAKGFALAHDQAYVESVLSCRADNGFGNRLASVAASLPWTSGSLYAAARRVAAVGGAACSPTSGFHHAGRSSGAGFCTFNGLAVVAILLKKERLASRVAVIDFDMHWGNGTEEIKNELGLGWLVNHSLGAFTQRLRTTEGVESWLADLPGELERVAGECDLILYQAGADPHVDDPLGGLLSSDQMRRRDRAVFRWAAGRGKPIAWNLAGGYQCPIENVLELHLATMEECLAVFEGESEATNDDPADLVDIDEEAAREALGRVRDDMLATGTWYESIGGYKGSYSGTEALVFNRVEGRRLLALGRSDFYDGFIERLERACGERVYQSDYMAWIDSGDPYASLLWYIESAERIDLSLEGIGASDLRLAAIDAIGPARDRHGLGVRFMTSWEINRIFWGPALKKTRWHLMGSMSRDDAWEALGRRVSREYIVESPESLHLDKTPDARSERCLEL
jgi:acetoin utilization deacetylase AcuC-like enzyme